MIQRFHLMPFQEDHIIARKHRGGSERSNLATACFHCNNHKGSNIAGIGAAVAAGIGVTALPRQRANLPGVVVWEDEGLANSMVIVPKKAPDRSAP